MDVSNDLTTTYLLIGIIVAIVFAIVFNLHMLTSAAKMLAVIVVLILAVGFGYYMHQQQNSELLEKSVASARNAGDAFGNVVRQLRD